MPPRAGPPRRVTVVLLLPAALALAALATPLSGQDPPATPPADHVVLVSIDGFRPDFYLDPAWPAPVLRQLKVEGAHAEGVRGVFPTLTYPSHTTMVTGALPARHGVPYNQPYEPGGRTGRWYWEEEAIRVPTLFDAVREAGGTTAAFSWPVTVGAPIDRNLPEIWPLESYEDRIDALRRAEAPAGFLDELEAEATGAWTTWGPDGPSTVWDQPWWDERTADMAAYTLARYRPTLMAVHVVAPDGAQHDRGRDHPEVRVAVAAADHLVGRLVRAAARAGILERTAFVVTGDHGFVDLDVALAPNVWLSEAGLLEAAEDGGRWRAAFHTAGGSAFLHLAGPGDTAAETEVREVLGALPRGVRGLFRILGRDSLDALGAAPEAALALAAEPGAYFVDGTDGPDVRPREGGGHGYHPGVDPDILTGFVAWGAGVREGAVAPVLDLVDVAPLVAALMGLDFEAPDGVLRAGLVEVRVVP